MKKCNVTKFVLIVCILFFGLDAFSQKKILKTHDDSITYIFTKVTFNQLKEQGYFLFPINSYKAGFFDVIQKKAAKFDTKTPPYCMTVAKTKQLTVNQKDSLGYYLGNLVATSFKELVEKEFSKSLVELCFKEVDKNLKPIIETDKLLPLAQKYMDDANSKKAQAQKMAGEKFLEDNKKRDGVKLLEEGIQYEVIKAGDGAIPTVEDEVTVHYKGMLIDGKVFDSSYDRNEPITFPLKNLIKGWQIAVTKMTKGSIWKIYLPAKMGYGDAGAGEIIPPGSTLIFDIELIDIKKK